MISLRLLHPEIEICACSLQDLIEGCAATGASPGCLSKKAHDLTVLSRISGTKLRITAEATDDPLRPSNLT